MMVDHHYYYLSKIDRNIKIRQIVAFISKMTQKSTNSVELRQILTNFYPKFHNLLRIENDPKINQFR
jgi:hypothetical protein